LEEIAAFIAKDSPLAAYKFIAYLRAKALSLGDIPHAFPLVPRYERAGIRRRPCGRYLIFYRADEGAVSIVRILHSARDYEILLFPAG
jgi:plasmid stabilization system protein ParE